jgi:hypothetical protein
MFFLDLLASINYIVGLTKMRKEVLYAIIAGIILGLIVAFGVWRINSSMSGKKESAISFATSTPEPTDNANSSNIVLDKPANDDVVTTDTVTVSGLTKPTSWVTLSGENGDYTVQSDTSGGFSQDVNLVPGVNQIEVTAFYPAGDGSGQTSNNTQVLVIYSSSFQTKAAATSSPATGSADLNATAPAAIQQKVAQDVANVVSQPKAYIGTVTDVTDSSIEIKTMASDIGQISIDPTSTTVINSTGTSPKTVKTTDIAIGDFIVAMGYVGNDSVLSAQRILVTDAVTAPKISVTEAKVASATKKALTVNKVADNSQDTVQPDKNTDIEAMINGQSTSAKFASIGANDTIIYVVTTDATGVSSVRSIFDVNSTQS